MAASGRTASPGAAGLPGLPEDADRAIAELYAAHWHRLVRLAWLLLHDQLAAEDAVQDAFVATHRSWSSIRDSGRAVGYLRTAVVNACRSAQRHQGVVERQHRRDAAAADVPGRGSLESAETEVLYAAERASMVTALRALPHRQREVLVLRYYLDLSEGQIAEALDISTGSVKAHAHRGLARLRADLSPAEPTTGPDLPDVEQ